MVLAYLAASIAKQGGRPPSPRSAMALMAALLAAQITWTVTKHQTNFGNRATSAAVASDASVVDDGGFSLALGVRRGEEGAAGGAAAGGYGNHDLEMAGGTPRHRVMGSKVGGLASWTTRRGND